MFDPGDVVVVDFPGVTGVKRRPAIVISSVTYRADRPDVIVGLLTSQVASATGASIGHCGIGSLPVYAEQPPSVPSFTPLPVQK